jgi:hypothetical protein
MGGAPDLRKSISYFIFLYFFFTELNSTQTNLILFFKKITPTKMNYSWSWRFLKWFLVYMFLVLRLLGVVMEPNLI